jgi:hypothetical protein
VDTESVLHPVTGLLEHIVNGAAVLRSELLRDLSQFSHALLPVIEFFHWASILVVAAFSVDILDVGLDLVLPAVKDLGVVENQRNLLGAATA